MIVNTVLFVKFKLHEWDYKFRKFLDIEKIKKVRRETSEKDCNCGTWFKQRWSRESSSFTCE